MFKSLRWRLQAWQALILFLAIGGFGTALFVEVSRARMEEIDAQLVAAARVLEGGLRAFPRGLLQPGPTDGPPGPGRPGPGGAMGPRRGRPPVPGDSPPGRPEDPRSRPPFQEPFAGTPEQLERMLDLPRSLEQKHADGDVVPYFAIWRTDDSVLKTTLPADELPSPVGFDELRPEEREFVPRQRGFLREITIPGPSQTRILVGCSVERELARLRRLIWQISLTGLSVFALGLVGGWFLSRRAVRPIEVMGSTAAAVTASSLSKRIELGDFDTELGHLGEILNSMLDRLQGAFEQLTRFTADASHELRTPVAVILSHAELALSRARSPDEYREAFRACLRASQRMKVLVDDLLTLARADAGRLDLRAQPLDVGQLTEECAALLRPLADQRDVALSVGGDPAETRADPERLGQLVTNLLTNAILYNRPGGRVAAKTSTEDGVVVLKVADTGLGIPSEDLPHVFDRFFRVDKSRSREAGKNGHSHAPRAHESGGSGLGLAICKSIVEAHKGTIVVESKIGLGTTFEVRLPS